MPRLFTREEAERLLPEIAPMLEEIRTLKRQHDAAEQETAALEVKMRGNGHGLDIELSRGRQSQQQAAAAINEMVEQVQKLGAEVKDMEMGLIDFHAMRDGREVYLCWKLGEDHIDWWHELNTGFASRQRLD
jgi:hypothetical protein